MEPLPQSQKNEIVVYQPDETLRLETRYAAESIWLPQLQIAKLFGVQKAAISKHLKNIYATGELERTATVSKMETVQAEGGRTVVRVQTKEPPLQGVFYQGRYWDAKSLLIKFIRRAKKELIVVDAYPGVANGECCQCENVARGQFQFPIEEAA